MPGFDLEEVGHLKYGRELHFWDFEKREPVESFYLGEDGLVPLEVKFHHNPDSTHGFCGVHFPQMLYIGENSDGKWQGKNNRHRKRDASRVAHSTTRRYVSNTCING